MKTEVIVLIVIVISLLGYFLTQYSEIIARRHRFKNAFSLVHFQLNQRYKLVPELIKIARSYIGHEDAILRSLILAGNNADEASDAATTNPANVKLIYQLIDAEIAFKKSLIDFYEFIENLPNLKSDTRLLEQIKAISLAEEQISTSQQAFNNAVMAYNSFRDRFPANLITRLFRLREAEFFLIDSNEAQKSTGFSYQ